MPRLTRSEPSARRSAPAQSRDQTQRATPEVSQRGNARIFYWGQTGSVGQLTIDYGQPAWNQQFDAQWKQLQGKRWRLGQNHWTNLDTNIDLTIAGKRIRAGHYYMTLEQGGDGRFLLAFLDPVRVHKRKLDAFHSWKTSGGIQVLLDHEEVTNLASTLRIALAVSGKNDDEAALVIRFGPHELSAPITMLRAKTVPK